MSVSLRQEFVSEFKAFYKLDKKKSSLKQPDDASIDSNPIIKGGGGVGGDEKENNSNTMTNNKMKIESSSSPTKSIEYFNNPPGRQKLTMETGGKWTMASNRGPNAILSPAAVTTAAATTATTSSDDNSSSTRNNDNVSISRSIRSNGNKSSKSSSQDETLWKEFKHEFAAYYMKKPAIVLSLDDSYEIEQEQKEESIPRELSFEERYSKMYKLHTQNTGVDVAQQQQVAGVGNVQEEEEEEEVEGDDPALLLQ